MKKIIICLLILVASSYITVAQCDTTFPMKSTYGGKVLCKDDYRYTIAYIGISEDYHATSAIVVAKNQNANEDHLYIDYDLDCKPSTEKMKNTKSKLINFEYNDTKTEFNYYISEFIDTATHTALAIEYGSIHNRLTEDSVKESYLLPVDRAEPYARFHKQIDLLEVNKYVHSNGSYLFEVYDKGVLCGIRYFSVTNQKEYKMFFW